MSTRTTTLFVEGMTCPSCSARIETALGALAGVRRAKAFHRGGRVEIEHEEAGFDPAAARELLGRLGYPPRSPRWPAIALGLLLVAAYGAAAASGLFRALPRVDASLGYAALFAVGLLTSIHCVAMCGGIALSQSLGPTGNPVADSDRGTLRRLLPGLAYNAGRILAYAGIGGLVGGLGALFSPSPALKGAIAGGAGLFMLLFGLGMLGLLAPVSGLARLLPPKLAGSLGRLRASLAGRSPFLVGLLNGFMPCGPLQTMQLYALGTGSAVRGALSLLVFGLGTAPLLLAFPLGFSLLPRKYAPLMVRASAVLVIFLGFLSFGRGAALAGLSPWPPSSLSASLPDAGSPGLPGPGLPKSRVADGKQTMFTEFSDSSYAAFSVRAGLPLTWTIRIKAEDINGCNSPLVIPALGIEKKLEPGDNLVEFTPEGAGTIAYSCWMGMITSSITVEGGAP